MQTRSLLHYTGESFLAPINLTGALEEQISIQQQAAN